ncbi:MAG: hypothetical protein R2755_08930 [Acidimicrobiales bacterium]
MHAAVLHLHPPSERRRRCVRLRQPPTAPQDRPHRSGDPVIEL